MPEEGGHPLHFPDGPERPVDLIDGLFDFAREFPALMREGWPLSWRHYRYGMKHLGRARARDSLRMAAAMGIGDVKPNERTKWYHRQESAAEW